MNLETTMRMILLQRHSIFLLLRLNVWWIEDIKTHLQKY